MDMKLQLRGTIAGNLHKLIVVFIILNNCMHICNWN